MVYTFIEGKAKVERKEEPRFNVIDTNNKLISESWFEDIEVWHNGSIKVKRDGKWNYIAKDGSFVFDTWYDELEEVQYGYFSAKDSDSGREYLIDDKGNIVFGEKFLSVLPFDDEGYAIVRTEQGYNFANKEGELVSDEFFDEVEEYDFEWREVAKVMRNKKYNLIDRKGNILSDIWFDWMEEGYAEGYLVVKRDGKYNFLDKEAKLLSDIWFDYAIDFHENCTFVKLDGKWNILTLYGQFLYEEWIEDKSKADELVRDFRACNCFHKPFEHWEE
jgi:hypothetical protein